MKCSLLTLSCALDGELSRERQSELETHLVTCERCRTGMRYLREETDRISQLVKVTVPNSTATALLERARVITIPTGESPSAAPTASETPEGGVSDPFNLMGIGGAQIIEIGGTAVSSAALVRDPIPPLLPVTLEPTADGDEGSDGVEGDPPQSGPMDEANTPEPEAEHPVTGAEPDFPQALTVPVEPEESWEELEFEEAAGQPDSDIPPEVVIPVADAGVETPDSALPPALSDAAVERPQPTLEEEDDAETDWLAASPAFGPSGGIEAGPPPLFVPFYLPTAEMDPPREDEEFEGPPANQVEPPGLATDPPEVPGHSFGSPLLADPVQDPGRESDEVMQVALEESALLGTLSALDHEGSGSLPMMPEPSTPVPTPPPPSVITDGDQTAAGWVPNSNLSLGFPDIAAARPEVAVPASDAASASAPPAIEPKSAPALPHRSRFAPTRPADSVAPRSRGTAGGDPVPPRRRPASGGPSGPGGRAERPTAPRSWTRTATVAIAALALFLIGWTVLHHGKATPPVAHQHSTSTINSKPTPTPHSSPTGSSGQTVTLTGTQTFGGTGSGYQVQSARFGLHQNNTQLWVVFQLVQGSGAPKVTTGFDGATALYLEMAGVGGGQSVSQPAAGGLVTSVRPTQMSGFSGAVYVLNLSRATTVISEYLLPGNGTSSSGERVVLELQN